jgi:hypothetical protein
MAKLQTVNLKLSGQYLSLQETMHNQDSIKIEQIFAIIKTQYPEWQTKLKKLFTDAQNLFAGKWPDYQACQTGYHTLGHSLDVALATARMTAGWNKKNHSDKIPPSIFAAGLAAALFHDSGYIMDKEDKKGKGGKYTFNHVQRSIKTAGDYLTNADWPQELIKLVINIIAITDFHKHPDLSLFPDINSGIIARMVGTADLVAQMADVNYLDSLKELYAEFQEAYEFNGQDKLRKNNIPVYANFNELLNGTVSFYQKFVLPRLDELGRIEQYLVPFFGNGRNPYQENITANLSAHFFSKRLQWRRLGEILADLGMVSPEQIKEALKRQAAENKNNPPRPPQHPRKRLLNWLMQTRLNNRCLGDILIEMGVVNADLLRKGLLAQIFPPRYSRNLDSAEYLSLLQIVVMLQNTKQDSWVMDEILAMIAEITKCRKCALFLAHPEKNKMVVAACSPAENTASNRTLQEIPLDKGLPGWVFLHGSPAIITGRQGTEGATDLPLARQNNLKEQETILAVPLHIMGEFIGVIELFGKKDGPFDDHDLDFMIILANILATSLDQLTLPL